jgi:two-component sensor histidine kinase
MGRLDFGDYLSRLGESLGTALIEDPDRVRLTCHAIPLMLDMDRAVPLALIASELITNSLKYAYPTPVEGEVRVELSRGAGDRATMVVRDHGRGFAGEPAPGFGLDIIRLFTSQLGAMLTLTGDGGVTARVEFAVPAEEEAAA